MRQADIIITRRDADDDDSLAISVLRGFTAAAGACHARRARLLNISPP